MIIYVFFYFGTIKIIIENKGIKNFNFGFDNKKIFCENPWEVKLRAGKFATGIIYTQNFLPKKIKIKQINFLQKKIKKISLDGEPKIQRWTYKDFFDNKKLQIDSFGKKNIYGDILFSQKKGIGVYAQRKAEKLFIRIFDLLNPKKQKILTFFEDDFLLKIFDKNFNLQKNGLVVTYKKNIYFYDFSKNKKQKIFTGEIKNFEKISVANDLRFVAKIKNNWYIFEPNFSKSKNAYFQKKLDKNIKFAYFFDNDLLEIRKNHIWMNEEKVFDTKLNLKNFDDFWIEGSCLFLSDKKEVIKFEF